MGLGEWRWSRGGGVYGCDAYLPEQGGNLALPCHAMPCQAWAPVGAAGTAMCMRVCKWAWHAVVRR